jgi:hypothetical protein
VSIVITHNVTPQTSHIQNSTVKVVLFRIKYVEVGSAGLFRAIFSAVDCQDTHTEA